MFEEVKPRPPIPGTRSAAKIAMGCPMDNQILRVLFSHTIVACDELDVDTELRNRVAAAPAKLPPRQVGRHGQVQEWLEEYDEPEPGHRHTSHRFGLHPGPTR